MTTIAKWMFPFVAGACIATGCSDEDNRYNIQIISGWP